VEVEIRVEGIQRLLIHSSEYVRVYFTFPDNPDAIQQCQLPIEAFDSGLAVGDAALATMLLRTVMEIRAPKVAS
jgi:hypothetical protein